MEHHWNGGGAAIDGEGGLGSIEPRTLFEISLVLDGAVEGSGDRFAVSLYPTLSI